MYKCQNIFPYKRKPCLMLPRCRQWRLYLAKNLTTIYFEQAWWGLLKEECAIKMHLCEQWINLWVMYIHNFGRCTYIHVYSKTCLVRTHLMPAKYVLTLQVYCIYTVHTEHMSFIHRLSCHRRCQRRQVFLYILLRSPNLLNIFIVMIIVLRSQFPYQQLLTYLVNNQT